MNNTMIECFIEAANTGSFTKAAENLYFTQQTVSRSVSLLENELNVLLFERTGTGLRITRMGRHYYAIFKSDVYNRSAVLETIAQAYEKLNSRIRIGCSEWIYPYGEILDSCNAFRKAYRGINLSMRIYDNQELLRQLMGKELDMVLFPESLLPATRDLEIIPLCADEIHLFGPDGLMGGALTGEQEEKRRELSLIIIPAWKQSYTEVTVRSRQVARIGPYVHKTRLVPNIESSCLAMGRGVHLAFADYRFGYLRKVGGLGSEPQGVQSSLCACVLLHTEHENTRKLIDHMKMSLGACVKSPKRLSSG